LITTTTNKAGDLPFPTQELGELLEPNAPVQAEDLRFPTQEVGELLEPNEAIDSTEVLQVNPYIIDNMNLLFPILVNKILISYMAIPL